MDIELGQQLVGGLRRQNPDATRLAEAISPAVRVEQGLLRQARFGEYPGMDVSAEADLVLSPLVDSWTPDWFVLNQGALDSLRSSLAEDQERFFRCFARVSRAHRSSPATIRLEEKILWHAYSEGGESQDQIDRELRRALGLLARDQEAHRHYARWFAGRYSFLPEKVRATEAYALFTFAAGAHLGGRWVGRPQRLSYRLLEQLPSLIPRKKATPLWLRISEQGLHVSSKHIPGYLEIEVPAMNPRVLFVSWEGGQELLLVNRNEDAFLEAVAGTTEIVTATGDGYRLRVKRAAIQAEVRSTPLWGDLAEGLLQFEEVGLFAVQDLFKNRSEVLGTGGEFQQNPFYSQRLLSRPTEALMIESKDLPRRVESFLTPGVWA